LDGVEGSEGDEREEAEEEEEDWLRANGEGCDGSSDGGGRSEKKMDWTGLPSV